MTGTDPAVPVFPAGYGPLPADFDAWVQAPFTFLTSKVIFRAQLQGSQALTGAAYTQVKYGTTAGDILEDPYGGWSTTATGSQGAWSWLCPAGCTGWYEITMTAFAGNPGTATDQVQAVIYLDGTIFQTASAAWGVNGHASGSCGVAMVPMVGGADYVSAYIYTQAAVATVATAGQYPTMEIAWVSE